MAVLGVIGIYVITLILFVVVTKADGVVIKTVALVLWLALILWIVIGKPAFWEGHRVLKIIGEIPCSLMLIVLLSKFMHKDDKKNEKGN